MNDNPQLLYDDQSFIREKQVNIQLIYFVFNNKSVISMNENLRKLISYLALDNIEFRDFIVYLLFIYSEKYKENYAIKYLRFHAVLFNSVLFPIYILKYSSSI
ncbi:hypothetical protein H8356DRAFT_1091517 [Neocallimastix lanati (nom. inval.)]|nr:hypothetical protein H8356DRAFT_1091517 [Neocallimastix sp. JGI-2020a]